MSFHPADLSSSSTWTELVAASSPTAVVPPSESSVQSPPLKPAASSTSAPPSPATLQVDTGTKAPAPTTTTADDTPLMTPVETSTIRVHYAPDPDAIYIVPRSAIEPTRALRSTPAQAGQQRGEGGGAGSEAAAGPHHKQATPPVCVAFNRGQCLAGRLCPLVHVQISSTTSSSSTAVVEGDTTSSSSSSTRLVPHIRNEGEWPVGGDGRPVPPYPVCTPPPELDRVLVSVRPPDGIGGSTSGGVTDDGIVERLPLNVLVETAAPCCIAARQRTSSSAHAVVPPPAAAAAGGAGEEEGGTAAAATASSIGTGGSLTRLHVHCVHWLVRRRCDYGARCGFVHAAWPSAALLRAVAAYVPRKKLSAAKPSAGGRHGVATLASPPSPAGVLVDGTSDEMMMQSYHQPPPPPPQYQYSTEVPTGGIRISRAVAPPRAAPRSGTSNTSAWVPCEPDGGDQQKRRRRGCRAGRFHRNQQEQRQLHSAPFPAGMPQPPPLPPPNPPAGFQPHFIASPPPPPMVPLHHHQPQQQQLPAGRPPTVILSSSPPVGSVPVAALPAGGGTPVGPFVDPATGEVITVSMMMSSAPPAMLPPPLQQQVGTQASSSGGAVFVAQPQPLSSPPPPLVHAVAAVATPPAAAPTAAGQQPAALAMLVPQQQQQP